MKQFPKRKHPINKDVRTAVPYLRFLQNQYVPEILDMLVQIDRPMSVSDIYFRLRIEQSVASQALSKLRRIGLVDVERHGKFIYYSANHAKIEKVTKAVQTFNKIIGQTKRDRNKTENKPVPNPA